MLGQNNLFLLRFKGFDPPQNAAVTYGAAVTQEMSIYLPHSLFSGFCSWHAAVGICGERSELVVETGCENKYKNLCNVG